MSAVARRFCFLFILFLPFIGSWLPIKISKAWFGLTNRLYAENKKYTLEWEELRKLKSIKKIPTGVAKWQSKVVTIPGFMVPLDGDERGITEFLLVPSPGQCIHVPPPPPNQMVHVKMKSGKIEYSWEPIIVKGTFKVHKSKSQFGNALFAITATKISNYY